MKANNVFKASIKPLATKPLHIIFLLLSILTVQSSAQILKLDTDFNAAVSDAPSSVYVSGE